MYRSRKLFWAEKGTRKQICYSLDDYRENKSSKAFISQSQEETNKIVGKINTDLDSTPEVERLYRNTEVKKKEVLSVQKEI
jgi:hypothetical protein